MKNRLTKAAWVGACVVACASGIVAAPKPSEVPTKWELDFSFPEVPQPIRFTMPDGQKQTFWFFRFTINNPTREDQLYVPDFVLYTDTGQVLRADAGVPTGVFRQIQRIYNEPLLLGTSSVTGKILQGRDNAKQSVAIFTDIDPKAGSFDLFVGGLSGETALIKLPKPIEVSETTAGGKTRTVQRHDVPLVKTLKLTYKIPGEAAGRFRTKARLAEKSWVMR